MTRGASALCIATALVSGALSANVCTDGVMQSPVNLKTCSAKPTHGGDKDETFNIPEEREAIKLNYGATQMELEKVCSGSAGCVVRLYPRSPAGSDPANMMEVAGAEHTRHYALDHCTIRMPAEHLINGRVAPLELQCHHTMAHTGGKRKGILSTLYTASAASSFIGAFANNLPSTAGTTGKTTVTGSWTPTGSAGLTRYHSYQGSHTIGGCAEDVDWFIMYDPTGASQAQLDLLANSMTWMAARPVQDLYGREPEGCPTHHVGSAHGAASLNALMLAAALFFAFCEM